MDNIKGVSNYIAPAMKGDVKGPETPQEKPAEQNDQVQLGGDKPEMPQAMKPHKKWLFLNYIAADCNLTEYQLKNIDNQELVGSDNNTHVVAYVDVGPKPNPMDNTWQGARSYYVNKDDTPNKINSELIAEYGDHVDMSDPKTLTKYVVDAVGKFPADHVCLVLNDHGGGFTGAMSDETDGNFMSVPQIRDALDKAQEVTGKKIDIIGFDACLMAEAEVAYELKDKANIMLAAEESEGGPGWTYNSMLGGENISQAIKTAQEAMIHKINVGPEEFAKIVVNVNKQHNEDIPTFSAVNLNKMDAFKDSLNEFAKTVRKSGDKESVKAAIQGAENYGGGWTPYKDIRDVGHLADNLIANAKDPALKGAAEKMAKAVKDVVIANEVNPQSHPKSQGISVYAPIDKPSLEYNYGDLKFAKDSEWDEMLQELGVGGAPSEGRATPRFWTDGTVRKSKE
ncbi:MAG: clostripain-related cysteine peptidase [Candidatus Eremiobacteraeota bacterium]|nr:clostripain-related cysteine peptidase [Candidatus Eremiobacteraeota bacterium]